MAILEAKFIKIPKLEDVSQEETKKIFENMLGHTYAIQYSNFGEGYIILTGKTKEAEKEYEESIYKSLLAIGEDDEYARQVAKGEEDFGGCMYFDKECFEFEN